MVDMASGVSILLNMLSKDGAYETHLKLTIAIISRYGHTIKTFLFDNDHLLVDNNIARLIMIDNKLVAELTDRDNHHRIDAAERRWQTLDSMAMSMLQNSCLGLDFMAFTITDANYILNRGWSDNKHCIPLDKLTNVSTIDLSHLRVIGYHCYVQIDPHNARNSRTKLARVYSLAITDVTVTILYRIPKLNVLYILTVW
jgi:hypothetical protein